MYSKVNSRILDLLFKITGKEFVSTDAETLEKFSRDETEDLSFPPEVVVKPASTLQISEILKLANEHLIPVYTRGGGTGLSGGALAVHGGIVISMERFNKIIDIDKDNFQVTVEAGVITQVFQEELEKEGLFYPVDPASRGSCFIGGNIAECSGGPRAAKYGVTRNYVLALEFVTPEGEIISTGSRTIKNVTGYSLAQLLTGSEGTLGIITKIVFRVLSLPEFKKLLLIAFNSVNDCISSVSEIYSRGVNPAALEFLEKAAIKAAESQLSKVFPNSEAEAQLLIEIDGNDEEQLNSEVEKIAETVEKFNPLDIILAEDRSKMEELWALRRSVGEAVKSISTYKEEDTVVPRAKMPELLEGVRNITGKYGIRAICYGHAGDGNLHVNILKDNLSNEFWNNNIKTAVKEIFELTVSLGGTISGEHGIGYSQKEYLSIALSEEEINLSKKIKKVFDPNEILNPGKIFTD
ncbi:MAG TPA: FAD-linked oxidase C-terminal domain-containing protein, partial [Ignavibacteria bacterium]|nr:FAD-linked oxidase C-terminal domain-containing protein [Ignavibacteria bacterium]